MGSKCFRVTVVPYWRRSNWRIRSTGPQDSFFAIAGPVAHPAQNAPAPLLESWRDISVIDLAPACGAFGNCRERSLSVEVQRAAEQAALHESVRPRPRPRLCSARHSDTTIQQ
jgi:hypothetical protein